MDSTFPSSRTLPAWARRMRVEREARGWSQADAVRALRMHADRPLVADASLLRNWKRWEKGEGRPDAFYRPLIAKTLGTVTGAMFPQAQFHQDVSSADMDTLELVARLRGSDVDAATLEALALTVERLSCEYASATPEHLLGEGRLWMQRMTQLLDRRLTLSQHCDVLHLAGRLALLVGCVEYDVGQKPGAEATRQAALSLGKESGSADIIGWAHEMRAWYALTQGDYRAVVDAAEAGQAAVPRQGVSVQLAAQKAKAWARLGDRRQVEVTLDQGRALLESLPQPENLRNHFVVDPAKYDFYAMDCYRLLGEDRLAETYALEVLRTGVDPGGHERSPMRNAEARVTLGVVAARAGDVEAAVQHGRAALAGPRKSLPSLLMTSRDLARALRAHDTPETAGYLDELHELAGR